MGEQSKLLIHKMKINTASSITVCKLETSFLNDI